MSLDIMKKSLSLAENLLGHVPEHFLPEDVNLLRRACTFAEKHYGHMTHPTTKPYSEYVFHVAKLLIELDVNAVVVSAAVICLPLSVAKEVFTDIKKEFKDKQELLELVDEVSGMSYFEWGTWLDKAEESGLEERRET